VREIGNKKQHKQTHSIKFCSGQKLMRKKLTKEKKTTKFYTHIVTNLELQVATHMRCTSLASKTSLQLVMLLIMPMYMG
jgi:hypothetical protein